MIFFILVLFYLIFLSYLDIKNEQIPNGYPLVLLVIGIVYRVYTRNIWITIAGLSFMFIVSYLLWKKTGFGGADTKILVALTPLLPYSGTGNLPITLVFFLLYLAVLGLIYSKVWYFIGRADKEELPFLPIITISYAISLIMQFH